MILVIMVARKLWRRRSWHFGDHGFRGDEKAGDRGRALKGRAHHLGGVDNLISRLRVGVNLMNPVTSH
jgi:hypothetical protein